tara:strand:- start:477 stop:1151 length:675 start_codon:yes stop_codon:yes gene_type:complete
MKISKNTMDILKNYSEINQSIVIKEGNEIKTISALKNILSKTVVKEHFPKDFAIYDLPTFIGFHSLMTEPDFSFNDDCVIMSDKNGKGKYFYAEPSLVVTPPDKDINMPESDIQFELKNEVLEDIMKKANVLKLADIGLKSCPKSKGLYLYATNKKSSSSNDYSVKVGETDGDKFDIIFKKDNLKIIPGDYHVTITNGISHFKNQEHDLDYWISLEADSQYKGD